MDIVMTELDAIHGTVAVESVTGIGCTVTIKLPLTLVIITAIIARIGKGVYAIPLETVAEIITVPQNEIQYIQRHRLIPRAVGGTPLFDEGVCHILSETNQFGIRPTSIRFRLVVWRSTPASAIRRLRNRRIECLRGGHSVRRFLGYGALEVEWGGMR